MANNPSTRDGESDLAILHPERDMTIAGVALVMREYTFAETLKHASRLNALSDSMTGIAMNGNFADLDSLRAAFSDNWESLIEVIAVACDQSPDWVARLGATDGETLQMLWWSVNSDFFLRRVLLSVQLRKVRELAGRTSSAPSPAPDTAPPANSVSTPAAN